MRVKRSKSWDMKYNWLRDHIAQEQFTIKWDKGVNNLADYFTKHHPPNHHKTLRSTYTLKGFDSVNNSKNFDRTVRARVC